VRTGIGASAVVSRGIAAGLELGDPAFEHADDIGTVPS
jgi:hypothetical protein